MITAPLWIRFSALPFIKSIHLLLKILCKDSDWGLFLITTGQLTLYSVQFFIVSIFFLENC